MDDMDLAPCPRKAVKFNHLLASIFQIYVEAHEIHFIILYTFNLCAIYPYASFILNIYLSLTLMQARYVALNTM